MEIKLTGFDNELELVVGEGFRDNLLVVGLSNRVNSNYLFIDMVWLRAVKVLVEEVVEVGWW